MADICNECAIEWIKGSEYAGVTAHSNSKLKGRIEELAEKYPDDVKILAANLDGSIFAHIPVGYVKINPPRQISDEQREKSRERMKNWKLDRGLL